MNYKDVPYNPKEINQLIGDYWKAKEELEKIGSAQQYAITIPLSELPNWQRWQNGELSTEEYAKIQMGKIAKGLEARNK